MTLKELKAEHSDIILDSNQPTWENLECMANGQVLFLVLVYPGTRTPKNDRQIYWAGQVMTIGINDTKTELLFVRMTIQGSAIVDSISKEDLSDSGRATLFHTTPFSANDRRNRKPWYKW